MRETLKSMGRSGYEANPAPWPSFQRSTDISLLVYCLIILEYHWLWCGYHTTSNAVIQCSILFTLQALWMRLMLFCRAVALKFLSRSVCSCDRQSTTVTFVAYGTGSNKVTSKLMKVWDSLLEAPVEIDLLFNIIALLCQFQLSDGTSSSCPIQTHVGSSDVHTSAIVTMGKISWVSIMHVQCTLILSRPIYWEWSSWYCKCAVHCAAGPSPWMKFHPAQLRTFALHKILNCGPWALNHCCANNCGVAQ